VIVRPGVAARRTTGTVNRSLTAVMGFYEYQARAGNRLAERLVDHTRRGRGSYKPFLAGIARMRSRARVGRLPGERRLPQTLSLDQVQQILAVQERLRERFLFALLFATGMRIGQALGLRHEDVVTWERLIRIVPREENANGARAKGGAGAVPVSEALLRLHGEYMHREYGDLDSDYVFVNLWGGQIGRPMTYHGVREAVLRTARRVGFHFTPHQFRHTYATLARRDGVPLEVISALLTHRSVQSTEIYAHAGVEDLRRALHAAGVLDRMAQVL
jgi:integrase